MCYFNVIELTDSINWNEIVTSFQNYDVYYLYNYVLAFFIHGDGIPYLIHYESNGLRGINVFMKRDISHFAPFNNLIESGTYFDFTTPYGYGGFLFEGDTSEAAMKTFYERYAEFLNIENVISSFVRYHPQLKNANTMRSVTSITDLGRTITIDLDSKDKIWTNFSSRNRTQIRKAERLGVGIHHGKTVKLLEVFRSIYNDTMTVNQADRYYFFERNFYESIHSDLHDNYEIFYAVYEEKIVAISIMLFANNRMHCHLLGSLIEYRNLAPSNLLISEAAFWGNEQGFKTLHLGGGLGSEEDNLFRFKKSFNINSDQIFSVGKEIINQKVYDLLVGLRSKNESNFDCNSLFFPLYRAL